MAKSKRGFSFELRNSKQNRALGVASLRANLAKCGAFRWVCLKGVTNSKLNTALRSKGTAWALALKVVEANLGLLRKQKGGEAFSVLLLLAKIAIFALKRR
ncbi:hypothetical protein ACW7S6_001651 [Campylobacter upsaliensis]